MHTVRSAPPTATLLPPSSLLHAPRRRVFSYPAGAPCSTRWTRVGVGEKGRTSWIMVCEDNEGDSTKWPDGESARDVGVSVCPPRVYTSAFLRRSYTWEKGKPGQIVESRRNGLRTWISLSIAPTKTLLPSALQQTLVTGQPTSNVPTACLLPSSPPSHTLTVPSSLPVATSSTPAPPAKVLSRELMMPWCARSLRARSPVVTSV
jgi:hypothetical protein